MNDTRTSFYYDPARQGYDTNSWRTIVGSPTLSSGRIQVDSGSGIGTAIHYADILKGDIGFDVNVPSIPGVNSNRYFGISNGQGNAYVRFVITDSLYCQTSDGVTTSISSAITWDSAWTGANTNFRIRWEAGRVNFYVNGTKVYGVSDSSVPCGPLSLYLSDDSGSAMTVGIIDVKGTQSFVMNPVTSDTTSPSYGLIRVSDGLGVTDQLTSVKTSAVIMNAFEPVAIADVVSLTRV